MKINIELELGEGVELKYPLNADELSALAKILATSAPTNWLKDQERYEDLLSQVDVATFWHDQYRIANLDRMHLRKRIHVYQNKFSEWLSENSF